MKKLLTYLMVLLFFPLSSFSQRATYYPSTTVKFIQMASDTVEAPFTGGFVAPQFSEIDLNGDAYMDLFVFDRDGGKVMCYLNRGIPNTPAYSYAPQYNGLFPKMAGWVLLRDYNCDGKMDIFTSDEQSQIRVFKNTSSTGRLSFQLAYDVLLDKTDYALTMARNDIPAIDDIDGDGDLDILGFPPSGGLVYLYRNQQKEESLSCDSLRFKWVDPCWGAFSEGGIGNTVYLNQDCFLPIDYSTLALHTGSTLLTLDLDDDQDKDLLMGDVEFPDLLSLRNIKSDSNWYRDTMVSFSGNFPQNTRPASIENFPAAYYLDVTNDGIKDLLVSSNATNAAKNIHQNWLYTNKRKSSFPDFSFQDSTFLQAQTLDFGSMSSPCFFDADGDGDEDLVLGYAGKYTETLDGRDQLALFLNNGDSIAKFKLSTLDYLGFSSKAYRQIRPLFIDMNSDGKKDLLLGQANGKLSFFLNEGTPQTPNFTLISDTYASIDVGALSSPAAADINGDSLVDLVLGCYAGALKYYPNRGTKTLAKFDSVPAIDTLWKVWVNAFNYKLNQAGTDTEKVFHYIGSSTPLFADMDGDSFPELLCGSEMGEVQIYSIKGRSLNDSIDPIRAYLLLPQITDTTIIDIGKRSFPAVCDLNKDGKPDIMVGTSRGGIEYFQSSYTAPDSVQISIEPVSVRKLQAFPNPSKHEVRVDISKPFQTDGRLILYALNGTKVYEAPWPAEADSTFIQVEKIPSGLYFLFVIGDESKTETLKISVIH